MKTIMYIEYTEVENTHTHTKKHILEYTEEDTYIENIHSNNNKEKCIH